MTNQTISEKLLSTLVASVKDYAIFMLDPDGLILTWNEGAERIKGYNDSEIIGVHFSVFYTHQDIEKKEPEQNLRETLLKGSFEKEGWRVRKDGSIFWANVVFTSLFDENKRLVGFAKVTRDITERKKADFVKDDLNIELKKSLSAKTEKVIATELLYHKLIENSYDGVSLLDKDLNLLYRSESSKRINGWEDEERMGKSGIAFVHPDDREMVTASLKQIFIKPETPLFCTYRNLHKQGHYLWLECIYNNMLHDQAINAIVCNFRDVTGRMQDEAKLLKANEELTKYKYALDEAALVAITDQKGIISYVNDNFCRVSKYSAEELIGQDHRIINSSYHSKEYISNLWKTIARGQVWMGEFRNKAKDGSFYWVNATIVPFLNEKGKPYQYMAIRNDITEQKLAQQLLQQSEANLRSVFENTELCIILFDKHLKIVSYNSNASWYARQIWEKFLTPGQSAYEYFTSERMAVIEKVVERINNNEMVEYDAIYEIAEKGRQWFEIKWRGVPNAGGENTGTILTIKNITERKQAELEANKLMAKLVQQNNDLEQFTYIISHNLRAPVANIKGLADLLNEVEGQVDEQAKTLQALSKSVDHLDKVIIDLNQILQTGNVTSERIDEVSLIELTREICDELTLAILKNSVVINCDFSEVATIRTLKSYIYSVFQNLMANSIKYCRTEAKPEITIKTKLNGDRVAIYFKDNGKGIDLQRHSNQLFGLYKRFDYTVEGKGMGLFMVKRQVESLEGTISVKSELNKGTEFLIDLPL